MKSVDVDFLIIFNFQLVYVRSIETSNVGIRYANFVPLARPKESTFWKLTT